MATAAKKQFRQNWSATASNDVILLTRNETKVPPLHEVDGKTMLNAVSTKSLPALISAGAHDAAGFGGHFRDAAVCSFQILRAWQGRRVPPWLQTHRASELSEAAEKHHEYPVIAEVMREYVQDSLDVPGLDDVLKICYIFKPFIFFDMMNIFY